ncbi:MAG: AsmA-like C-terminal region-containing protein [Desulfobacteraceae bacterium]|nr:AsmA-like C-terminal region-containing protein [Desulfobacteraceae bacterium]
MKPYLTIRIKKFIFCGITLILVLLFLSPFIINWGINSHYVKNKISSFVYQNTGNRIEPSKFKLSLVPKPSLIIENFNFIPDKKINLNIGFLKFNIDIQNLLQGQISVNQVIIDRPKIKIISDKEKHPASKIDFSFSKYIAPINKIFKFLPNHQDSVTFKFTNATSEYFKHLEGSLFVFKKNKEIALDATLDGIKINLSDFSNNPLNTYLNLENIEFAKIKMGVKLDSKGELNGQLAFISPMLRTKKDQLLFDSNTIETSFKLSDSYYKIDTKPFTINYPKSKVSIHFVSDYLQKKSQIQFIGETIQIEQAKKMSLLLFKDNEVTQDIFDILHEGIVPKIIVTLKSKELKKLFNEHNLELKGNVENTTVKIPETHLIASQVYGKAKIVKGVLEINTNSGMIQTSRIGKGNLTVDLLNYVDFPFQGNFDLNVDLAMLPKTLRSLLPNTLLADELSLVHNVKGTSDANLKLSMKTNSDDLDVYVQSSDFTINGIYDRIPGEISLQNINLKFEPDILTLKNLTGTVNHSKLKNINTTINLKKDWITIPSGSGTLDLDSIIPWLMAYNKTKKIISPIKDGNGTVDITSIDLSGPILKPEQWKYKITGSGKGIDLTSQLEQKQIQNLTCQYQITDEFMRFQNIQMKASQLTWLKQFIDEKHYKSITVPFNVKKANFQIGKPSSYFNSDLEFNNGVNLSLNLKGETINALNLNQIKIFDSKVSEASVSFNYDIEEPLINFTGFLDTTTLNKLVVSDSHWAKKIEECTDGEPIKISADKNSTLNISTKSFNLNPIISGSKKSSFSNRLFQNGIINFKADKLKIKKIFITDIDSKLSLKKDHSYIKLNSGFLCDVETKGYINLKDDIVYADVPFKAENKSNIQELLTCLFQKNNFMDGRYSITCDLKSSSPKKDFINKLAGSLSFEAQEGRIYKLTLLSRILSVLNFSKIFKGNVPNITQKGFAYKNITIKADIKDSKIHLKKAVIDGQDMTLIFNGWIDPVNDKINLTCLVAPFKTVDIIIEKIPIINTLLGGRLVSVPAKATGKLSDPTVIPLHPSAVGKGLIDMMGTILKTPFTLWDKITGDDDE